MDINDTSELLTSADQVACGKNIYYIKNNILYLYHKKLSTVIDTDVTSVAINNDVLDEIYYIKKGLLINYNDNIVVAKNVS